MKIQKIIWTSLICVSALFAQTKIVAKVGEQSITQFQVDAMVNQKLQKTFFHQKLPENKKKELDKEALDELIDKELLFQYAKDNNLSASKNKIGEIQATIIKRFPNYKAFETALNKNNMTIKALQREINVEESMTAIYEKLVKTEVTLKDLETYYETNKYKFKKPESKSFQLILINIDPTKKEGVKEAKEKISDLKTQIEQGASFDELAQKHSNDMSRINGGRVGFVHKGTFKYLKEEDLNALKVGELSSIIQTDIGFYLVKLLEAMPEQQLSFEEVQKSLKKDLRTSLERKKLKALLKEQRSKTKVELY